MSVNISQPTIDAIQSMVKESFIDNSIVDRMKSVLGVDLAYNVTADLIHLNIAHYFSGLMGDGLGDLIEGHNQSVIYGGLPVQEKVYSNATQVLEELLTLVVDYQDDLNVCAKIALDNMDTHTYMGLLKLIEDFDKIVQQCILMVDKIHVYKDNMSFDAHIKDNFWIL